MEFKFILTTILMCLISLESSESCLDWTEWKEYKLNYSIQFYNSTLESIA
jgi:hypothetical protein